MRKNTTKEVVVDAMIEQIEQGQEVHIPTYQISFPNLNYRTLAYYKEMAINHCRGSMSARLEIAEKLSHQIKDELDMVKQIEKYQNWSLFFALITGAIVSGFLVFVITISVLTK